MYFVLHLHGIELRRQLYQVSFMNGNNVGLLQNYY